MRQFWERKEHIYIPDAGVNEPQAVAIQSAEDDHLLKPLDEINGFKVRPGYYRMEGAHVTPNGVSFTISSHGATKCTLLLFHPQEDRKSVV